LLLNFLVEYTKLDEPIPIITITINLKIAVNKSTNFVKTTAAYEVTNAKRTIKN